MNPVSPAKVGVAFLAGIVVALGSALIYVKASGTHTNPVAPSAPVVQRAGGQPETITPEEVPAQAVPAAAAPAKTSAPAQTAAASPTQPASAPVTPPEPEYRASVPAKPAHRTYPRKSSLPTTQSNIRVEVSQMKPSTLPPGAVPASQPPVRISEDQTQLPVAPKINPPPAQQPYSNPAPPPARQPHTVTLQAGTNLTIRLGETLSTDHNYTGDTFRGNLDAPIIIDGFIIAEKGSKVLGKIVAADKAGKLQGTANLQLVLTEINTTDGQRVPVETSFFDKKGASNTGTEAAKIGGGAALGAIIGAIAGGGKGAAIGAGAGGAAGTGAVLLGHGKPAVIPNETRLTFQLTSPAAITEQIN